MADSDTTDEHGVAEATQPGRSAVPDRGAQRDEALSFLAAMRAKNEVAPAAQPAGAKDAAKATAPAKAPAEAEDPPADEPPVDEAAEPEEPAADEPAEPDAEPEVEPDPEAEPEEERPSPEVARRLEMIRRQEQHSREQIRLEREKLEHERAEHREALAKLESFNSLRTRAKYAPDAVLAELGLTDEDMEAAARAVFARSPLAQKDPKNREAAEKMMREREYHDKLATLEKRLNESEAKERQRIEQETASREAAKYLGGIKKAAGVVYNARGEAQVDAKLAAKAPIAAHFLAKGGGAAVRTEQRLGAIAIELSQELGYLPEANEVLAAYETMRRAELEEEGYDVASLLKPKAKPAAGKPAGKPAQAAPAGQAAKPPAKPAAPAAATSPTQPAAPAKPQNDFQRREAMVEELARRRVQAH